MAACLNQIVFLLSFGLLIMIGAGTDVCDICSCFEYEQDTYVISCKSYKNHVLEIDFETIEWPTIETNENINAFFNHFPVNLLPKIPGDSNVVSINFDDNNIRTIASNPFEYFTNLKEISLANNHIADLTKDFLKSQTNLRLLNLSNNTLSTIDPNIIAHLNELHEINLSHNFLTKITADFLEATSHVEVMRLENNKLYVIDNAYDKINYLLRELFLAHNHFTVITSAMFEKLTNLEVIDLSDNKISNIDNEAFTKLTALRLLDLSINSIKRITVQLPDSLELLTINNNNLNSWPLLNVPENLKELEIQDNSLDYLFPRDKRVPSLVKLDASRNLLHQLPDAQFVNLEYLNLGFNLLNSVPDNINEKAPFLKDLILDGNEIADIEFVEPTTLESISLCNMTSLHKINAYALQNLSGKNLTSDQLETCVAVKIAYNENLVEIEPDAFYGVRFCDLDLSYNNLQTVPQNLTDWKNIENGVNLQGNPLLCSCEQQWILKDIMETLYSNPDHQELLLELRCEYPEEYRRRRLVQFLNHNNSFCNGIDDTEVLESGFGQFLSNSFSLSNDSSHTEEKIKFHLTPWTPGFLIIVGLCTIILILIIIVGVKWQRDQNLKLARRNRLYYDDY
ncbi:carboxypeptidase N subunit 2-like [Chironomus tepperi]|uniref:carboxypeptidase N subunit 2-like n=1 Tax=Chironomus tepperi TaxID=113505 RepID=UPI00391F7132